MEAALADAAFVDAESEQAFALAVVPLGLASHDRDAGQVALSVVVLVTLLRLPPEKALL